MALWDDVLGVVGEVADAVVDTGRDLLDAAGEAASDTGEAVGDFVEGVGNAVVGGVSGVAGAVIGFVASLADGVSATLGNVVRAGGAIFQGALDILKTAIAAFAGFFRWLGDTAQWILSGRWLDGLFLPVIVESFDDHPAASVRRLAADAMSIAVVTDETSLSDSGPRRFFRIEAGEVKFQEPGAGWQTLAPNGSSLPLAISFHEGRRGRELGDTPRFDMVAANAGRVLVKEEGRSRFYCTMLEPMFRREGNRPVPSIYFKLDPEQGQSDANDADRLVHLVGADSDHPAALRVPLFRLVCRVPFSGVSPVNLDLNRRAWHRIDARPPEGAAKPPAGPEYPRRSPLVTYQGLFGKKDKLGYKFDTVLDIGVGHEHWHEHDQSIYGGEIDSLDGPGLPPILRGRAVYRFFNGPVDDQGGFIDGTVNYYLLVQFPDTDELTTPPQENAFGILWLDEQAALSERWRLLHPDDHRFGGVMDVVPSAAVQYMDKVPEHAPILFNRSKFWCPFRARNIRPESRMAVSRQTVVVSGVEAAAGGRVELYSINFSFGTCDRTWRWRLPPDTSTPPENVGPSNLVSFATSPAATGTVGQGGTTALALGPAVVATGGEVVIDVGTDAPRPPEPPTATLLPGQMGLREDMTLYIRQEASGRAWYWFQKYLPADGQHVPAGEALELPSNATEADVAESRTRTNGPKPKDPYPHRWQFVRAPAFEAMHARFSHFGVYKPAVDSRSQYYTFEVGCGAAAARSRGETQAWEDFARDLFILCDCLDWGRVNDRLRPLLQNPAAVVLDPSILSELPEDLGNALGVIAGALVGRADIDDVARAVQDLVNTPFVLSEHKRGLFHDRFRFRLLDRGPLGWILVHWDKRDDDLMAFSNTLPQRLELRPLGAQGPMVTGRVLRRRVVRRPPVVPEARLRVLRQGERPTAVSIRFRSPGTDEDLLENVWRVSLGALGGPADGPFGVHVVLFDRLRHEAFTRETPGSDWHAHVWNVAAESAAVVDDVAAYVSESGRRASGLSLWFENVTGHVATPDLLLVEEA
jgi:hypothetical protein